MKKIFLFALLFIFEVAVGAGIGAYIAVVENNEYENIGPVIGEMSYDHMFISDEDGEEIGADLEADQGGSSEESQLVDVSTDTDEAIEESVTETEDVVTIFDIDIEEEGIDIEIENATTVEDCGYSGCLEEKFVLCEPAIGSADIDIAAIETRIIGPAQGGCQVTYTFTRNPNPDWEGATMLCVLDNTNDLQAEWEKAFADIAGGGGVCAGRLVELIRGL